MAKNVWTFPDGERWANKREGANRLSKVLATKAEAQAAGRKSAMRAKVEHLISNRDGGIGERNSYGNDPCRFKG